MRHYATACRSWQVEVLAKSLDRHCRPYTLHVLAWDWDPRERAIVSTPDAVVVYTPRGAFMREHPGFFLPGDPRSPTDEVCSVRWRWFADTVRRVRDHDGGSLMCIDGDCWFWDDPEPLWRELESQSRPWALTEHRFPSSRFRDVPGATEESHGKYGLHNGGWSWFRDPQPALDVAALTEAWCRGTFLEYDGRPYYGDQGAIDRIHEIVPAHVLGLAWPGVNAAPWNLNRYSVARQPDGGIWLGEPAGANGPLVLMHYSSLRFDARGEVVQLADPGYALSEYHAQLLYPPYIQAVKEVLSR